MFQAFDHNRPASLLTVYEEDVWAAIRRAIDEREILRVREVCQEIRRKHGGSAVLIPYIDKLIEETALAAGVPICIGDHESCISIAA